MDWISLVLTHPVTPLALLAVVFMAVIADLLTPRNRVIRITKEADERIAAAEKAAAVEVARVEKLRVDEVARVEKLNDRVIAQKDELLREQRETIHSLTESVRMYARAAEVDITTADIVRNVVQALQAEQYPQQRQLEGGGPRG